MATHDGDALLSPFDLRDIRLSNRVALAPLTRGRSGPDRLAPPLMAEYYAQRANAGLLISEATAISAEGYGWVDAPGIYTDEQAESWKPVVRRVHDEASPFFLQLWHTGRASHSDFHDGAPPVAPSAIRLEGDRAHTPRGKKPHEIPRALRTDELPRIVADYAAAARRADDAGFDGVEIHAANGYLLDQFLQSRTNRRTDGYGGSVENRFRLLREVTAAVSDAIGSRRVGVRLAPNGAFNDMGSPDYREQFLHAARGLERFDLAYLHIVDGVAFGFHELGEPMTLRDFREVFSGPIIGNAGYDRESAEAAVASGAADLIAFGRAFISNPDLVERFRHGRPLEPFSDPSTWYGASPPSVGYTDFPLDERSVRATA